MLYVKLLRLAACTLFKLGILQVKIRWLTLQWQLVHGRRCLLGAQLRQELNERHICVDDGHELKR